MRSASRVAVSLAACGLSLAHFGPRGECMSPVRSEKTAYLNASGFLGGRENSVYDIALGTGGRLCVPDYRHDRLLWFDLELRRTGVTGGIPTPHGVAFGPDGSLFVATYRAGRVLRFGPEGKEVPGWDARLVKEGRIVHPVSVALDDSGRVYIADYSLRRVVKAGPDGDWLLDMAPAGAGGFLPHGISTDGSSRVYAADRALRSIRVFSLEGRLLGKWPAPARDFDPLAVRLFGEGLAAVASYTDGRIHLFDLSGKPAGAFGGPGAEDGLFQGPTNLVVTSEGRAFVVEEGGNRIQRLDVSGALPRRRAR